MNVVITGSSKGIGRGLAEEFVRRGHNVMVSSRTESAVDEAVKSLASIGPGKAVGHVADVTNIGHVRALWDHAMRSFGSVDIWVNNAGMTNAKLALHELPEEQIPAVVATNLTGLINGTKVAVEGMLRQQRGRIFNMEGFGSDGMVQPGMAVYGATKRAARYFTKSMVKEYDDSGLVIGYLSPGIVVTDLLTRDLYGPDSEEFRERKKFLNILADRVETVAPALVEGMLAADKNGATVRWLSGPQAAGRFLKSFFVRREVL